MYHVAGPLLTAAELAPVAQAVKALDLRAGPGGSFATADAPTRAALEPVLLPHFPGPWAQVRVFGIYPSAQIVGHCDPPIRGRRYHLPLSTNPGCWVFHGGTWQQLEEGRFYAMDPAVQHGAVNWSAALRLHVVIDKEQ